MIRVPHPGSRGPAPAKAAPAPKPAPASREASPISDAGPEAAGIDLQRAERLGHRVRPAVSALSPGTAPLQRARGGVEITEGGTTTLTSHAGGGAPVGTRPVGNSTFGATQVEAYRVRDADLAAWVGAERGVSHTVLRDNRLKLTNDVRSAEWVIEGHGANLTASQLVDQTMEDVGLLYATRDQLKGYVEVANQPNHKTVLAPGGTGDLRAPGPEGLFVYRADDAAAGKAQITAQYANAASIRRINELNASKFLTGTKVAEGQDANRVAGSPGLTQSLADLSGSTSSATAASLLTDLVAQSAPIVGGGGVALTAEQVGLIKLMVINDAMASTLSRHNGLAGEAQEKNMQRFFPKAQRQTYVNAVARTNVAAPILGALRPVIVNARAAMAQAVWDRADPFALAMDEAQRERLETATATGFDANAARLAALAAAPAVPPATVDLAIAAIRPAVVRDAATGGSVAALTPPAALAITAATLVANPAATAIADALVRAAVTARGAAFGDLAVLHTARQTNRAGGATTLADRNAIKDLVLGANGGVLAGWIGRAALAYTDATGNAGDHVAGNTGNVIHSDQGFTRVAGAGQGAIYEFREREVDVSKDSRSALKATLKSLFGATD